MQLTKQQIKDYQYKLNFLLSVSMPVDGDYGTMTKGYVKAFQTKVGLYPDGIIGNKTAAKINAAYNITKQDISILGFKQRFVVFVDAGHGGMNEQGNYVTPGKRAYHEGLDLHKGGHYFEGYENRIIAEDFINECTKHGIMCIRLYHPYKDTSLSQRTEIVRSWLKRGYYGYLQSFHSNAISIENSKEKLENTTGFCVYTTVGNTLSDRIAQQHFQNTKDIIGAENWNFREQKRKDRDSDYEANFYILRQTDLKEFSNFGAMLEEFGFHTSKKDCEFITNPHIRKKRVAANLKTALWVREEMKNI